jgi:serine/threonine protein kinase
MPIPRELDEIVLACLEKDPSRRPQNADELLRMLRRCRSAETWDNDAARVWWEKHLLDLTGPLTMDAGSPETVDRTLVVH